MWLKLRGSVAPEQVVIPQLELLDSTQLFDTSMAGLDQVQFSHGLNPGRGPRFPDRLFNLQSSGPFVQVSFQRGHNEGSQPSLHAKIWFCQPCIASGPSIVAGGQGCCEAPSAPYGVAASVFAKRAKQPTKLVPKVLTQLCAFCIFPDGSACRSSHQAGCVWAVDS